MHTIAQIRSGELAGIHRLNLQADLDVFPEEIFDLADSLEVLDLSNNRLSTLPHDLHRLHKLKAIFCSNNPFKSLPESLGLCPNLSMVGFKSCEIESVPAEALPKNLRWLILTNNKIEVLPDQIGRCLKLQKLMLAGNRLRSIPQSIENCSNLQLIRIAANELSEFPEQLLNLPKLAWFAFSGNPFCVTDNNFDSALKVRMDEIVMGEELGRGASGVIYRASWRSPKKGLPEQFALKIFKGAVTSDGYPADELSVCLHLGRHENLVNTIAYVDEKDCLAALMELIPSDYINLGLPPSLDSCTRDVFDEKFKLNTASAEQLISQMQATLLHLKSLKIAHGDIYAHNVLISACSHLLFGDFGASSAYGYLPLAIQEKIERVEARAFEYFVDDIRSIPSV